MRTGRQACLNGRFDIFYLTSPAAGGAGCRSDSDEIPRKERDVRATATKSHGKNGPPRRGATGCAKERLRLRKSHRQNSVHLHRLCDFWPKLAQAISIFASKCRFWSPLVREMPQTRISSSTPAQSRHKLPSYS